MSNTPYFNESPPVEPRWLMPVVDVLLVFIAFGMAYVLRYDLQLIRPVIDPTRAEFAPYLPYAACYAFLLFVNYQSNQLYRNFRGRSLSEEVTIIVNGVTIATVILLAMFFLIQPLITSRLMLVYVAALTVLLLAFVRVVRRIVLAQLRAKGIGVQRTLIVGMKETGHAVLSVMISRSDLGYRVVGFLDDDPAKVEVDLGRIQGLGNYDALEQVLEAQHVELVVFTLSWHENETVQRMAKLCMAHGVEVRIVPDVFHHNMRQVQVENLDGIPLLSVSESATFSTSARLSKRLLDLGLVIVFAPLWLVVMGVIALLIKLDDGGSVFYVQRRVGEGGRTFNMVKFRTMIPNADKLLPELIAKYQLDPKHPKLANDPRQTRVGRVLRRTSLDELPNLFNVLRGEMSLVGPRPAVPEEVALYQDWHKQRLRAVPGITGLWQISGRSDVPFEEMCLMDIYYIETWSLKFDLQILLMTIPRVLLRVGAY